METPKVLSRALKYSRDWKDIKYKYKNRAVEKYALSLWTHLSELTILREYLPVIREYNNRSILLMEELKSLMQIIVEANTGAIRGQKFTITELDNLNLIRDDAEFLLNKRLDEFEPKEFLYMWFDLTPKHITEAWDKCCLDKIYTLFELKYHNDGHIDNQSLLEHIDIMSQAIEDTRNLPLYSEDVLLIDFLLFAKRIGVPMTNKAYLDLYEFMQDIDLIPPEVLKSHEANTRHYVRENYIKAIYHRNQWMDNYPPLKNYTEEDIDRMRNDKKQSK